MVRFLILDRIHPNPRGGDFNKLLLQTELRWIFNLKATLLPGLNKAFNFKPFLEGFQSLFLYFYMCVALIILYMIASAGLSTLALIYIAYCPKCNIFASNMYCTHLFFIQGSCWSGWCTLSPWLLAGVPCRGGW